MYLLAMIRPIGDSTLPLGVSEWSVYACTPLWTGSLSRLYSLPLALAVAPAGTEKMNE